MSTPSMDPDRLMVRLDLTMGLEAAVLMADLAEVAQERDEVAARLTAVEAIVAEQAALIEELRAALDLATPPRPAVRGRRPASAYARAA